jgi:hypothetical protein
VFCELFPDATIFTLVRVPGAVSPRIEGMRIEASVLSRLPGISRYYRMFLPLFPLLVERFDLTGYDLILSSSHCVAKGVRVPRGALHACYIFTPMRYVWDLYDDYFGPGRASPLRRSLWPRSAIGCSAGTWPSRHGPPLRCDFATRGRAGNTTAREA